MTTVFVAIKGKKMCGDFCSAIEESNDIKVTNIFSTIKDCRDSLVTAVPDVLLLGLDLTANKKDANWIDFCIHIRNTYPTLKILTVVTYDQYAENKEVLNKITSGYISMDALPKVIISAIEAVKKGKFFRYDKIASPARKEEPKPEWLDTMKREMIKNVIVDGTDQESVDKLSQFIDATDKIRTDMIVDMLAKGKEHLDADWVDKNLMLLIENQLIKGYPNWEIADTLNVSIEIVRLYRLEFILRISGKNSMAYGVRNDGKHINLRRRELQLLRLIAAGYTNQEIAEKIFYRDVETIKSVRKDLIDKFGAKNTISMIMSALRMGLINLEDIDMLS